MPITKSDPSYLTCSGSRKANLRNFLNIFRCAALGIGNYQTQISKLSDLNDKLGIVHDEFVFHQLDANIEMPLSKGAYQIKIKMPEELATEIKDFYKALVF